MNLRHFIRQQQAVAVLDDGSTTESNDMTYYMIKDSAGQFEATDEKTGRGLTEIVRILTCAIFHKIASGQGVPHTFTGTYAMQVLLPYL